MKYNRRVCRSLNVDVQIIITLALLYVCSLNQKPHCGQIFSNIRIIYDTPLNN